MALLTYFKAIFIELSKDNKLEKSFTLSKNFIISLPKSFISQKLFPSFLVITFSQKPYFTTFLMPKYIQNNLPRF